MKVGRPISKPNRVKIGLSITPIADKILCDLVKRTGKTKSRIFEEAMKIMEQREETIYQRMLDLETGKHKFLTQTELNILLNQTEEK